MAVPEAASGSTHEGPDWHGLYNKLRDTTNSITQTIKILMEIEEEASGYPPNETTLRTQLVNQLLVVMEQHPEVVAIQLSTLECLAKLMASSNCPTTSLLSAVVSAMSRYPHHATLQATACSVLCQIDLESLDPDDPKTREELPAPDDIACALVAAARHHGNVELQILALHTSTTFIRAQMIDNPYPSMLTRIGLCEATVAAMDAHKACLDLQLAGMQAILSLTRAAFHIIDVDVPSRLQSSGAHGTTLRAMRWHTSNKQVGG